MNSSRFDQLLSRQNTGSIKWEKYANTDVIPMWVADMEFATAPEIIAALKNRLDHPILGYTTGTESLARTVTDYLKKTHDWQIDPDWLVWLPGVVPGLAMLTSMLGDDDQIMVFTPVYHPLLLLPEKYNRKRVDVPLVYANNRWSIDFTTFEKSINKHCKMLFLCSPHNPLGTLFSADELRRVVEICSAHNILVISDEIHCDLVLHKTLTHTTTGRVAGDNLSNLVTLMSPSKTFNLAGANCSYAVIPDATYRETYKEKCMYTLPIVPTLAFTAARAAYQHGWQWHTELIEYLRGNLQLLRSEVDHLPYLSMDNPDATYLAWINTATLPVKDAYQFFINAGVGLSPGAQFGNADYQRLNFACSRVQLKTAIDRIKVAVGELQG